MKYEQICPCSHTVVEVKPMKPISVKCQICNFRLFDVRPETAPHGVISIKCKGCGKISDIDIAECAKNPPQKPERTNTSKENN